MSAISRRTIVVCCPSRALRLDLRQHNDRIRYVLLARIAAARETEDRTSGPSRFTISGLAAELGMTVGRLNAADRTARCRRGRERLERAVGGDLRGDR